MVTARSSTWDRDCATLGVTRDPKAEVGPLRTDARRFGTRHQSMMRLCFARPGSVGFVVSQDGNVRAIPGFETASSSGTTSSFGALEALLPHVVCRVSQTKLKPPPRPVSVEARNQLNRFSDLRRR